MWYFDNQTLFCKYLGATFPSSHIFFGSISQEKNDDILNFWQLYHYLLWSHLGMMIGIFLFPDTVHKPASFFGFFVLADTFWLFMAMHRVNIRGLWEIYLKITCRPHPALIILPSPGHSEPSWDFFGSLDELYVQESIIIDFHVT